MPTAPSHTPSSLSPDSPLFDGYTPDLLDGTRYVDDNGGLIYPDASDVSRPYGVPGTFIDDYQPPAGTVFDRFGGPRGGGLSPDGAPFEQRSLPPNSATMEYHRYEVADLSKLPAGVRLEYSEIAPWFGQPGGAGQLRVIAPPDVPELAKIQALLDSGYLREVKWMSQFDTISTIFLDLANPFYDPVVDDHGTEVTFRYRRLGAGFAWRLYQLDDGRWTTDVTDDRNHTDTAVGRCSTLELAQLSLVKQWAGSTPTTQQITQEGKLSPHVTVIPGETPYCVQLISAAGTMTTAELYAPLYSQLMALPYDDAVALLLKDVPKR